MLAENEVFDPHKKAVIYCRVSSKKQTADGSGLDTQEYRCRKYAAEKGYVVEEVFPDDVSGGGDFMNRPGMVSLLAYLDANPFENYVVIFDDLKRYARDTEFHLALRREMAARNATRECLNFRFENSPEGEFVETIFAAQAQLERQQNRRQVLQKMKARVEQGFWVKKAPIGYIYVKSPRGGKELVWSEPLASIVREALEGFASGRFASQTEVQRFLERQPDYPKDMPNGKLRPQTVPRLLRKPVYAGYVFSEEWGISLREGKHDGLISFQTHRRIMEKLEQGVYAPARKDIRKEFPLRGAVSCAMCCSPLTAAWSKGKTAKHAYYRCYNRDCGVYGKSIRRDKIEGDFEALLSSMQPSDKLGAMAAHMFRDCWKLLGGQAQGATDALKAKIMETEDNISGLVDRAVTATNPRVIAAYERNIGELEKEKLLLMEKLRNPGRTKHTFDELFELALKFLTNPYKLWVTGDLAMRKIVLRLAFSGHLQYCRDTGFLNPKTALPFRALGADSPLLEGHGAAGEIRTPDLSLTKGVLYP